MKAIVYTEYGPPDVLQLKEVEIPSPADDEVLVKVRAASLNAADWRLMKADPFPARFYAGLLKPTKFHILGADIAGRVEAVGSNVSRFQAGDEVFGNLSASPLGGFAEYACAREDELVPKPANTSFEEAAAVPLAALTALHGLRDKGRIQPGQKVLINGASGGVGTFAIQLANHFGAEVSAVCSTEKTDLAHSLGATHVIDYTRDDFTRSGQRYDLILAVNGYHSIFDYRRALNPRGTYVMVGGNAAQMFQTLLLGRWISLLGSRKMCALSSEANTEDLLILKSLLESGEIRPVIDRGYPLHEVAEAIRYLEAGHARGKVVVTMEHNDPV